MEAQLLRFRRGTRTLGNRARGHLYAIVARNLSSFCSYPENLREVKFKDNRLICLAEKISRWMVFRLALMKQLSLMESSVPLLRKPSALLVESVSSETDTAVATEATPTLKLHAVLGNVVFFTVY